MNKPFVLNSICRILIFNFFLFQSTFSYAQNCSCNDYVYLNETSGTGSVHKYLVNADGTLTEIGLPWYGGLELPKPHGLGADLNGNIYIGESVSGEIRKLNCDGQIVPESEFEIPVAGLFNIGTIGNSLYYNSRGNNATNIYEYDLCAQTQIATVGFCETDFANNDDWGFYVDPNTGEMYATNDIFLSANNNNYFWYFNPSDFDNDPNTCISAVNLGPEFPATQADIRGVVTDDMGNVYIAVQDDRNITPEPSYILKYGPAPTFTYIATSAFDSAEDGIGYRKIIGLVFSQSSGLIYASTESVVDDCVSIFDTNLNYVGTAVPNPGDDSRAKGIALNTECCPNDAVQDLSTILCVSAVPYETNINALYDCNATICEGLWELDNSVANTTFESCQQNIVYLDEGCATFTKVSDGSGNKQCGAFNITLEVCVYIEPAEPAISLTNNVCNPLTNGSINIDTPCAIGSIEYSTDGGATWSATTPTYDTANPITVRARCATADGCASGETADFTSAPQECCPPQNCISQFGAFTIIKNEP